jgi:hypothetical protein
MFILELDHYVYQPVLVFLVVVVPMAGMVMTAMLIMFVPIIVFRIHSDLSNLNYLP